MRSPIGSTAAKSFGPTIRWARAVFASRPDRDSRSIWLPGTDELVAHVLGGRHVDHAMALALRTEHREVAARGVAQLEVHAGAAATERADDLADEALALRRTEARDDGEPRVEVERERSAARLDDDSLALHHRSNRQAGGRS